MTVPPTTVGALPDFLVDFASSGVAAPSAIAATALRYEYEGFEDVLAHIASGGTRSFDDIVAVAAQVGSGMAPDPTVFASLKSRGTYALAYLVFGRPHEGVFQPAADLFALARMVADRDGSPHEYARHDIQANLAVGRADYVRQHIRDVSDRWIPWAVEADIIHPTAGIEPATADVWHTVFNRPFVARGIAPMRFRFDGSPFDSVTTDAVAGSVDGPLVSIVMPVFSPSASLFTAVRSVLEQTWANLQVIVVDDASPEEFAPIFRQVAALDERVEYVRAPTNGGAYRARNLGISRARGDFVGIQDGDDWSHPERIQRQLAMFDERPELMATLSRAVRLYGDLRITRVGSLPFALNAPSLIFRREPVLERLGLFDELRKAADTEYIERIAAVFGDTTVDTLFEPLSLYQLTEGSLSREDFRPSWHREARVSYHGSFRHWHHGLSTHLVEPVVKTPAGRAFPAPPELAGVSYPMSSPDIVVHGDWREGPLATVGLPAEVAALAAAGLRVGISRADTMRLATDKRYYPRPEIEQLLADGAAAWTPLGAPLDAAVLLVRDVDLLVRPRSAGAVNLRPRRVVVTADRRPAGGPAPTLTYDPVQVEGVVDAMFGTATEWLPSTEAIGRSLADAGARGLIHAPRRLGVVSVVRFPHRPAVGAPVIGVNEVSSFGAERGRRDSLTDLLPRGRGYDIRVLESSSRRRAYASLGWLRFHPGIVTTTEFLDQCDFVVALPRQVSGTEPARPILEAMARGCVAIVPEDLEPIFGPAALYHGSRTVTELIRAHPVGSDAFERQQQRGLSLCQTEFSAEVFASAITTLVRTGDSS